AYVNANGDPTVDLRSNMGAESRAKIVYEYLLKFTDDPYVKETLKFLMTREVSHIQMFAAALPTFQPYFPPCVRQADPRYSNVYFNMSKGAEARGPWNDGISIQLGEPWKYVADPQAQVDKTNGLVDSETDDTTKTSQSLKEREADLSKKKVKEINSATPEKDI